MEKAIEKNILYFDIEMENQEEEDESEINSLNLIVEFF